MKSDKPLQETLKLYSCPNPTCEYKKLMDINCMGTQIGCNACGIKHNKNMWSNDEMGDLVLKKEKKQAKKKKEKKEKKQTKKKK